MYLETLVTYVNEVTDLKSEVRFDLEAVWRLRWPQRLL